MNRFSWAPIRKVAVGFAASLAVYGAHRLGLPLGPSEAEGFVTPLVGFAVAYLVRDPRVRKAKRDVERSEMLAAAEAAALAALSPKSYGGSE